jgi:hypothetical protein
VITSLSTVSFIDGIFPSMNDCPPNGPSGAYQLRGAVVPVLHRAIRQHGSFNGQCLVKTLYGYVSNVLFWGRIGRRCGTPPGAYPTLGRDHALMKRNLIAAAFTLTVLATAACGGGDGAVKPTATKAPTSSSMTSSPASSPTPTIDPKAQLAVEAYLNFVTALAEASKSPRKLGQSYLPAADFTKFSFDPVRGQANASIASLSEHGQLFKGDPGRPRVSVAAIELDATPYPKVVLKDCPTPTPTWRIYDAKTGKAMAMTLPPGTKPTPYLSTVEVIYYQGRWGVSKINADTSRTCTA